MAPSIMLGAFVAYTIWKYLLIPTVGFYIASVLAALIMAGLGLIIELFLLRRLYSRGWPEQLLATYAIVLMITDLVKWALGRRISFHPETETLPGGCLSLWVSFSLLQFRHHYSGFDRRPLSLVVRLPNTPRRYYPGGCPRPGHGFRPGNPHSLAVHVDIRSWSLDCRIERSRRSPLRGDLPRDGYRDHRRMFCSRCHRGHGKPSRNPLGVFYRRTSLFLRDHV